MQARTRQWLLGAVAVKPARPREDGGMQRDEQREGGFRDTGYVRLAAAILGKGAPTPHAHFGARIEGDDPATAVLVIDAVYHGRLVPGWVAQAGGGPVALDDNASAEGADLPKP